LTAVARAHLLTGLGQRVHRIRHTHLTAIHMLVALAGRVAAATCASRTLTDRCSHNLTKGMYCRHELDALYHVAPTGAQLCARPGSLYHRLGLAARR
jgi:hypothetical protein